MTGRISVLHIGKFYPPYKGGMETHLHTLCTAIRDRVDVRVVVANAAAETIEEVVDGVPVTRLGKLLDIGSAPFTPGLRRVIGRSRADIVHVHWPHPTAVLSYLASGFGGRLIVTYHSDIVRQRILGTAFRPLLHLALDRASAIICTSPNYIDSSPVLSKHRARCRVLPFSIPIERFERADASLVESLRRTYGPRIILAVGRLVSYKGFDVLIRAMQLVSARLLLVGNGPLDGALRMVAAECGVTEKVTFLDHVEDVVPYFHAADVFALPSVARSEAFGIVQLEAMASAVPVVNTSIDSGVPYVSPHDVTGLTVPPGDALALACALSSLLDDPVRRQRLGEAGRERVRTRFAVELMAERTIALYDGAMRFEPRKPIEGFQESIVD